MRNTKKTSLIRQIRRLPRDLRSKHSEKRKDAWITLLILLLVIAMALMGVYVAVWYINQNRIISDSQRYQSMYASQPVDQNTPAATAKPVTWATKKPAPDATDAPTIRDASVSVNASAASASPAPTTAVSLEPMATAEPDVLISPLATPNENTLVYALPTAPPVQSAFDELLTLNSETIGFLTIDDVIALPVVQRENDNEYYLDHNFERNEASEGALFLDGANRLVPEDDCLIVYGHNMKNNTMFGSLADFAEPSFLKKHPVIHFDTLYENRSYVPFAVFSASMDPDSYHYFDVRQFMFDNVSFEMFTSEMRSRSFCDIPLDVQWGDRLLLLVTCDYVNTSGRFILCLRQLRADESEDAVRSMMQNVPEE